MTTRVQQVKIGGTTIPIAPAKREVNETTTAFYKQIERDNLDTNKLNELFMKAVATQQKKYDFIDLKINDPDMLKDTYNLEMAIETIRINNSRFNMHDVFMIVEPDADPTKFKIHNLYKNHATLTEAQVAASNEWYLNMIEDPNNVKPCVRNPTTKEFQQLNPDEEEKYKLSLYESIKHKLLHFDWIIFDM